MYTDDGFSGPISSSTPVESSFRKQRKPKASKLKSPGPEVIPENQVPLPRWYNEDLLPHLRAGVAHTFLLHGDIDGFVRNPEDDESNQPYIPLKIFLRKLLDQREMVIFYNIDEGIQFLDPAMEKEFRKLAGLEEDEKNPVAAAKAELVKRRPLPRDPDTCLPLIKKVFKNKERVAAVIQSAHFIAPSSEGVALLPNERANIECLRNLSQDRELRDNGALLFLLTDQAAKVSSELKQAGSEIHLVLIPKPNKEERRALIQSLTEKSEQQRRLESRLEELQEEWKGLKPSSPRVFEIQEETRATEEALERYPPTFPVSKDFDADVFAHATQGMSLRQVLEMFFLAKNKGQISIAHVKNKKREILNAEYGDVMEVVEPAKGLDDIGGLEHIKTYFREVLEAIRKGETQLIPMGILLSGPPGTGKTAIVEALANEAGFNFVKMKSAFSMWVGASEAKREKQIYGLRALAPVVVMNDEADLTDASRDTPKGDSGVSERLMKAWMEFLSDPRIRGQIIVISCSNRPDRMDPALKRSGRTDERLLVPMPSPEERVAVLAVAFRYHKIPTTITDFSVFTEGTGAFSGADIVEKIVPTAYRFAVKEGKKEVNEECLQAAIKDTIPSASQAEIDLMTLLGLLECSSRRLLPPHIKEIVEGIRSRNHVRNLNALLLQIKARDILDIDLGDIKENGADAAESQGKDPVGTYL